MKVPPTFYLCEMLAHDELVVLVTRLNEVAERGKASDFADPLRALEAASDRVGKAFGGSWVGYHSRVYYADFEPPPPGAAFSQEWGMERPFSDIGSRGDWREYSADAVTTHIIALAGTPDLKKLHQFASEAERVFDASKSEALSIISSELDQRRDTFLASLKSEIEKIRIASSQVLIDYAKPKGQFITRDTLALGQGVAVPPHILLHVEAITLQGPPAMCQKLSGVIAKAASHLERQDKRKGMPTQSSANVFIGHGRSHMWRELKDFISERIHLPWDEFNRVPVAGLTNIARLSEMLDAAAIAFLVMTAEDEMADGGMQARMNVVHEAGLFQGRLGFTKAILLLEEGCAEFSNIQGLGQIRFPKGNISASFEHIRRVLEREGLVTA